MKKEIEHIEVEYRCLITKDSGYTFKKLLHAADLKGAIEESIKRFYKRQEEKHYTDNYIEELEINKYYIVYYTDGTKGRHNAFTDTVYKKSYIKDQEVVPLLNPESFVNIKLDEFGLDETLESVSEINLLNSLVANA